jgi:hypothetical protein
MAAEDRGPLMHAHVDMMLALHGAKPSPEFNPTKALEADPPSARPRVYRTRRSPKDHQQDARRRGDRITGAMSPFGTKLPIHDVRSSVAIGWKTDIAASPNSVENDPSRILARILPCWYGRRCSMPC